MDSGELSGKKVLVTGATGFIGHRLAEILAKDQNARVIGAGRKLEKAASLKDHDVQLISPDLTDPDDLKKAFKDVTYIFHCAGALGGDDDTAEKINVKATEEILKTAASSGVKRVIHVSTVGVYRMDGSNEVYETTPLAVEHSSNYPRTKARGEKIAFEKGKEYNIEVTAVRPSMVYGPGNGVWTTMMYNNVCQGKPVFLGNGSYNFNPIYLDDLVEAMLRAATTPAAAGEAFNISAEVTTWKNFMNYYAQLCDKEPKGIPLFVAKIMASANKIPGIKTPVDKGFIEMATSKKNFPVKKANRLLNWQPSTSLDEGMEHTISWLKQHVKN